MQFPKTAFHVGGGPFFQLSVGKFLKTLNSFQLCTKRKLMTMKRFIAFLSIALASFGCTKEGRFVWEGNNPEDAEIAHDMIVLGERLPDPYSIEYMTKALQAVSPHGGRTTLDPTDFYVRFLPKDDAQMQTLIDKGLELMDYPLDYRIVRHGDWYHDPSLPEEDITWQYAVVPVDFQFPKDIRYERLDDCFIADHNPSTKADGIDWDAVEQEAYRLTGNEGLLMPSTKDSDAKETGQPKGRIAILDPDCDEEPIGVKGVKVCCNSFVKINTCYTDEEGYYSMERSFSSKVNYRLVFQNTKGFCQGINLILIPASVSTLGSQSPTGYSIVIDSNSDRKLFCRCAVNNAGYDYWTMVKEYGKALPAPPKDLRIWNVGLVNGELPLMVHHGVLLDTYEPLSSLLGNYTPLVKMLHPDIVIFNNEAYTYAEFYALALHAFAHAGHFGQVGKEWWSHYSEYVVKSLINTTLKSIYGERGSEGYSYCEIAEDFAYYCQNVLYKKRYPDSSSVFGTGYWFAPQLLLFLDERGLGLDKLGPLFTDDVCDIETLQDKLLSYYPSFKGVINEAFTRYGNQQ